MKTELLKIDNNSPEPQKVKKAADLLKNGAIVAFPTETVYGLAVNANDEEAVGRLYNVKKRPKDKQLTIQIADLSQLYEYIHKPTPELDSILKMFWPGPLTVIVKTKKGTIGLRMPDNKIALSIIKKAGVPVAVTSANISGEASLSSAQEILDMFNGQIEMVVDGTANSSGVESTVLDCTGPVFKILRQGPLADRLKGYLKIGN